MRRVFLWALRVPALAILLYLMAALVGAIVPNGTAQASGDAQVQIGLLRGPIHYDFLLPNTPQTREHLGFLAKTGIALDHPGAEWIILGWGGRDFYTTIGTYKDVSLRAVWRGITGDSSVMRVSLAGELSSDAPVRTIAFTEESYLTLLANITDSFAQGDKTQPIDHPGFSQFDRFYPANGRFNIFRTCNVWIGEMLRASGLRFGIWTPAPFSVTLSQKLNTNQSE